MKLIWFILTVLSLNFNYSMAQNLAGKDYLELAEMQRKAGYRAQARQYALKAYTMDNSLAKQVFTFVGDMCMASYADCKHENPVIAKSIYIVAYHYYMRANDLEKAAQAKAQFPSREEIFTHQQSPQNESITHLVDCWKKQSPLPMKDKD